jgi:hypothetical protein
MTRLAYLYDITFFCDYLVNQTDLTAAETPKNIKLQEFERIKAVDINNFRPRINRLDLMPENFPFGLGNDITLCYRNNVGCAQHGTYFGGGIKAYKVIDYADGKTAMNSRGAAMA